MKYLIYRGPEAPPQMDSDERPLNLAITYNKNTHKVSINLPVDKSLFYKIENNTLYVRYQEKEGYAERFLYDDPA